MIIVVGVAGSGKSTQSKMLVNGNGWCWISMGQLLRGSLTGQLEDEMNSGKLLDDNKVQNILYAELSKVVPSCKVVLDGFPRRANQAKWLINASREVGDPVEAVVHLVAQEDIVMGRLLQRGRPDDKPEAINERLLEYHTDIKPLLHLFTASNIPVVEVNGERNPDIVHEQVLQELRLKNIAI